MATRARLEPVKGVSKYHPVTTAISKAQAALWLLGELEHGDLGTELNRGPVTVQPHPRMPLPQEEMHDWLTGLAFDAIEDALVEAKEEFVKSQAPSGGA